jgi:mono/diheme cytochrome c family protein
MIGHNLLAFLLGFLLVAAAEAQSLKLADRKGARTFSTQELLASPLARDLTIAKDAVYGRPMTYRAIAVPELLKGLEVGPQDYVDFVATDKFSVGIPARLLLRPGNPRPQAFLAIQNPAAPWPALPDKAPETAAPFYVVWHDARPGEISPEYWVYKLAAIEVGDSPYKRWPSLEVAEDLPATHPARRGLDRYVALCISCHRFKGAGAGEQGPDLGQPMNPVDYFQPQALRTFLRSSKRVRDWPDRKMPSFNEEVMSNEDMDALITWLTYQARR